MTSWNFLDIVEYCVCVWGRIQGMVSVSLILLMHDYLCFPYSVFSWIPLRASTFSVKTCLHSLREERKKWISTRERLTLNLMGEYVYTVHVWMCGRINVWMLIEQKKRERVVFLVSLLSSSVILWDKFLISWCILSFSFRSSVNKRHGYCQMMLALCD